MTIKWRKIENELPDIDSHCLIKLKDCEDIYCNTVLFYSNVSADGDASNEDNVFCDDYYYYNVIEVTHWIYLHDLLKLHGLQ